MVLGAGGAATWGVGVATAVGVGATVVTVSGVNGPVGSGAGAGIEGVREGRAGVDASWVGAVTGGLTVADTEPLSPPPRMTTVQITATSSTAPAAPAIHIQRRSIGSTYS